MREDGEYEDNGCGGDDRGDDDYSPSAVLCNSDGDNFEVSLILLKC
jgi:hypothetical protein